MATSTASVGVVDDDPLMVKTYEMLFEHLAIPVAFVASNGPAALEKLKASGARPALILVDYRMPLMSGIELMREIKKTDPGIKVVFSSGDVSVQEEALKAGGDAFLRKPSRIEEIVDCISRLTACS